MKQSVFHDSCFSKHLCFEATTNNHHLPVKKRDSYEPLLLDLPWNISANGKAGGEKIFQVEADGLGSYVIWTFEHLQRGTIWTRDLTTQWSVGWFRKGTKKKKKKTKPKSGGFFGFLSGSVFFFADLTYSQAYIYIERRGYDKCYPRISHIEELNGCRPGLCVASCKKGSMPDDTGECPHQPGCYMD